MSIYDNISRILDPIKRRISLLVGRVIVRLINDSGGHQVLQVTGLSGETITGIERMQNYGITSSPPSGAEGIGVFLAGNRDNGIIIAVDDRRYRVTGLAEGEVCLYSMEDGSGSGHRVHFKSGREIEVITSDLTVTVDQDSQIAVAGDCDIIVSGDCSLDASNVYITSTTLVNIVSPVVNLGTIAGAAVARVGDSVSVDPITHIGSIISGSAIVKAG